MKRKPRRNQSEDTALLAEIRQMLVESKKIAEENKIFIQHSRDSLVQIASIETSIILVFKPLQDTVVSHGREILTFKARLNRLEAAVKALDPSWEVAPIC